VNIGALALLAVMSYFRGRWILDGLEALDQHWLAEQKARTDALTHAQQKAGP
jgi:hypothetical protein